MVLQAVSRGITQRGRKGLAKTSAGHLDILQGSIRSASDVQTSCVRSHLYFSSGRADGAMLKLMPALQRIDITVFEPPLRVPFHGTVYGKLICTTVRTLQQAKFVHCTGVDDKSANLAEFPVIDSIKIWAHCAFRTNVDNSALLQKALGCLYMC